MSTRCAGMSSLFRRRSCGSRDAVASPAVDWQLPWRARARRKRHLASLTQQPLALRLRCCTGAWQRRVQRRANAGRRGPLYRRDCAGSEQPRALQQPLRSTGASGSFRRTRRALTRSRHEPPGVRRGARVTECVFLAPGCAFQVLRGARGRSEGESLRPPAAGCVACLVC